MPPSIPFCCFLCVVLVQCNTEAVSSDEANQSSPTKWSETLLILINQLQETGGFSSKKVWNDSELTSTVQIDRPTAVQGCLGDLKASRQYEN